MTFERLAKADIRAADIVRALDHAYIAPVLTAHPTEVQRKSILDAERAISDVVDAVSRWRTFAAAAGVGRTSTTRSGAAIKAALAR
jgi:phosphoenolpyruvate carboxylase